MAMDSKRFQELVEESTFNHGSFADLFTCGVCDMKMWADNIHEHLQSHVSVCTKYQFNQETRTILPVFEDDDSAATSGQKRKLPVSSSSKQKAPTTSAKSILFDPINMLEHQYSDREQRMDSDIESYMNADRLSMILDQQQNKGPAFFAAKPQESDDQNPQGNSVENRLAVSIKGKKRSKNPKTKKPNKKSNSDESETNAVGLYEQVLGVGETVTKIDIPYIVEGKELGTYHCSVVVDSFSPKVKRKALPPRGPGGKFQKTTVVSSSSDESSDYESDDDINDPDYRALPLGASELQNAISSISEVLNSPIRTGTSQQPDTKSKKKKKGKGLKRGRKPYFGRVDGETERRLYRTRYRLKKDCESCTWTEEKISVLVNSELKREMAEFCTKVPSIEAYFASITVIQSFDIYRWAFKDIEKDVTTKDIGTEVISEEEWNEIFGLDIKQEIKEEPQSVWEQEQPVKPETVSLKLSDSVALSISNDMHKMIAQRIHDRSDNEKKESDRTAVHTGTAEPDQCKASNLLPEQGSSKKGKELSMANSGLNKDVAKASVPTDSLDMEITHAVSPQQGWDSDTSSKKQSSPHAAGKSEDVLEVSSDSSNETSEEKTKVSTPSPKNANKKEETKTTPTSGATHMLLNGVGGPYLVNLSELNNFISSPLNAVAPTNVFNYPMNVLNCSPYQTFGTGPFINFQQPQANFVSYVPVMSTKPSEPAVSSTVTAKTSEQCVVSSSTKTSDPVPAVSTKPSEKGESVNKQVNKNTCKQTNKTEDTRVGNSRKAMGFWKKIDSRIVKNVESGTGSLKLHQEEKDNEKQDIAIHQDKSTPAKSTENLKTSVSSLNKEEESSSCASASTPKKCGDIAELSKKVPRKAAGCKKTPTSKMTDCKVVLSKIDSSFEDQEMHSLRSTRNIKTMRQRKKLDEEASKESESVDQKTRSTNQSSVTSLDDSGQMTRGKTAATKKGRPSVTKDTTEKSTEECDNSEPTDADDEEKDKSHTDEDVEFVVGVGRSKRNRQPPKSLDKDQWVVSGLKKRKMESAKKEKNQVSVTIDKDKAVPKKRKSNIKKKVDEDKAGENETDFNDYDNGSIKSNSATEATGEKESASTDANTTTSLNATTSNSESTPQVDKPQTGTMFLPFNNQLINFQQPFVPIQQQIQPVQQFVPIMSQPTVVPVFSQSPFIQQSPFPLVAQPNIWTGGFPQFVMPQQIQPSTIFIPTISTDSVGSTAKKQKKSDQQKKKDNKTEGKKKVNREIQFTKSSEEKKNVEKLAKENSETRKKTDEKEREKKGNENVNDKKESESNDRKRSNEIVEEMNENKDIDDGIEMGNNDEIGSDETAVEKKKPDEKAMGMERSGEKAVGSENKGMSNNTGIYSNHVMKGCKYEEQKVSNTIQYFKVTIREDSPKEEESEEETTLNSIRINVTPKKSSRWWPKSIFHLELAERDSENNKDDGGETVGDGEARCLVCSAVIKSREEWGVHVKDNHECEEVIDRYLSKAKYFVCCACGRFEKNRTLYQKHIQKCKLAKEFGFDKYDVTKYSISAKYQSKFNNCPHCGKTFTSSYRLKVHKATCVLLNCDICTYETRYASELALHKKRVHNVMPYKCQHCDRRFAIKGHMVLHVRAAHDKTGFLPPKIKMNIICEFCGGVFSETQSYKKHVGLRHTGRSECLYCGQNQHAALPNSFHEGLHTGDFRYACVVCKVVIHSQMNYNIHMQKKHNIDSSYAKRITKTVRRVRGLIFTYICKECDESFINEDLYVKHMAAVHHMSEARAKEKRLLTLAGIKKELYYESVKMKSVIEVGHQINYDQVFVVKLNEKQAMDEELHGQEQT